MAQCHSLWPDGGVEPNLLHVDLDVDAEVGAALLDGVAEILERERAVLPGVARDDEAAAAADQLVDAEVLEVPAVGEIDPRVAVGGHAEQLVEQLAQRQPGACCRSTCREARVAQPPAQPHVEHRHQERQRRRRVIAHVGRGGGARGGDGQAHRERLVAGSGPTDACSAVRANASEPSRATRRHRPPGRRDRAVRRCGTRSRSSRA